MDKPTAIIDKSLLQRICGERAIQRDVLMGLLRAKYQLVVAFPLVDEILANIADCPQGKDPSVIAEMKRQIDALHMCFLNGVWEIAFEELVLNKPLHTLPMQRTKFLHGYAGLNLEDPEFVETVRKRKQLRKEDEDHSRKLQNDLIGSGVFHPVANERQFFMAMNDTLLLTLQDPARKIAFLEDRIGARFRHAHSEDASRIQAAFDGLDGTNIGSYPFTRNFLLVQLIYLSAPITKIVDRKFPPPILSRGDQRNNIEDSQYVASATLCERLLTGDEPMARVMQMLKANGLWNGEIIWIDKNDKDLATQISNRLL